MTNRGNTQGAGAILMGFGVLLIVSGAVFFVSQVVGFDLGRFAWPFFIIVPGLAAFGFGLAAGGGTGERITPLGSAVTMVGLILLYQNAADHFESWAYAWALVFPTAVGLGQMAYGSIKGRQELVATGRRLALIGIVLFLVGAFFFELAVGISGFGFGLDRFGWPLLLVILGMLLLLGGFIYRRR
jgi:hypothetical protein